MSYSRLILGQKGDENGRSNLVLPPIVKQEAAASENVPPPRAKQSSSNLFVSRKASEVNQLGSAAAAVKPIAQGRSIKEKTANFQDMSSL